METKYKDNKVKVTVIESRCPKLVMLSVSKGVCSTKSIVIMFVWLQ